MWFSRVLIDGREFRFSRLIKISSYSWFSLDFCCFNAINWEMQRNVSWTMEKELHVVTICIKIFIFSICLQLMNNYLISNCRLYFIIHFSHTYNFKIRYRVLCICLLKLLLLLVGDVLLLTLTGLIFVSLTGAAIVFLIVRKLRHQRASLRYLVRNKNLITDFGSLDGEFELNTKQWMYSTERIETFSYERNLLFTMNLHKLPLRP